MKWRFPAFVVAGLLGVVAAPLSAPASGAPLPDGQYRIPDHGQERLFEVAKDEVYVTPRARRGGVEKIAPLADTAAVRQYASGRRLATGDEYALVLYEVGRPRTEFTRRVLTPRVLVRLAPGTDPQALAAAVGAAAGGETPYAPGHFILETAEPGGALALASALRARPGVLAAEPLLARQAQKKFAPNDTYFTQQWHLRNTGQGGGTAGADVNLTNVWDTYKGDGITIAIVDDGLQWTHPDLTNRYNAALSWDFNGNDADPYPDIVLDDHGTACAGVAAAQGNNAKGVCGAAFNATLVGLRLIALPNTDADEAAALAHSNGVIQIKSNSWGVPDTGDILEGPGTLALHALAQGVAEGRGGKGIIYVWAAGNGLDVANGIYDNANYDGYANSIYTIPVAAVSDRGIQADYSEPGACIVVCAPSSSSGRQGITTTDLLLGTYGYNVYGAPGELADYDYTQTFGGTSSATPLAAGVCALVLQANPSLGWRDVQEILIRSATKNAPTDTDWTTNAAGFHFNHKYGAGLINAGAAVTLATNHWRNLSPQIDISSAQTNLAVAIPDNNSNGVTRTFNMAPLPALRVEHVTVTANILHSYRGQLAITLTSPAGTQSRLAERHADPNDNYAAWTFSSVHHWGESSGGDWTVKIADLAAGDTGVVTDVRLDLFGTTTNAHLALDSAAAAETLGNADGFLDPGETVAETVVLRNLGAAPASNLTATLSCATPGVTVLQSTAGYPDLAMNEAGTNLAAYTYRLAKTVPAGTPLDFTQVAVAAGQTFTNAFSHLAGQVTAAYATNTLSSTDVTKAIPDPGTVYSTNIVALAGTAYIDDVNVTVRINHTYDSDLEIGLQHPVGREVVLSYYNGRSGDNYGSGTTPTTFDDQATSVVYEASAPFAGTFRPEERLADLNGAPANGIWRLRVTDVLGTYTGTLVNWGLRIVSHTNRYAGTLYNTPPVAGDAGYAIPAGAATNLTLAATDADGDPLTYLTNNTAVANPLSYTPPAGFTGLTNFTFAATDTYATSAVATVTLNVVSTTADSDHDGLTDWQEILCGTDPHNAASVLGLATVPGGPFAFDGVTGRTYRIEYKDNLSDPQWQPLATTNGIGGPVQIADPAAPSLPWRFYRVRLLP